MKLANIARRFDRLTCTDKFTPATSFKAQMDVFDDTKRDGVTAQRRILSTDPSVVLPYRRTLDIAGETWVVGELNKDYFLSSAIRHKYIIQSAEYPTVLKTFSQAISGAAGYSLYAGRIWVKPTKEVDTSSNEFNVYDLMFAAGEPVTSGQLAYLDSKWYLIRLTHMSQGGFVVATSDELPEPVIVSVTFGNRQYVPLSDTYTESPKVVNMIRLRWQSYFRYTQMGAEKYRQGDIVGLVAKSDISTVKPGDKVTVNGNIYVVEGHTDEGLCWAVHLRDA